MKSVLSDRIKKAGTVLSVPVDLIESNPNKVRKDFSNLDELTESVRKNGIIQPLTVRIVNNKLQIISGERRYRVALRLSLEAIPCIIMDVNDEKSILLSLTENSFSVKPDFYEEAEALYILNTLYEATPDYMSQLLCKTANSIDATLSFYKFSPEIRQLITENSLQSCILSLSKLKSDNDRLKFIEFILSGQGIKTEKAENEVKPIIRYNKPDNHRIFMNSILHTVEAMRNAGINAVITQKKCSGCIECVIRIPEMTTSPVRTVGFSCDAV